MSIAEKINTVYQNTDKVFHAGEQAEYDRFWDSYQANGFRTEYVCAFAGGGWKAANFKPKYDINVTNGYMMFRQTGLNGDLVELMENAGVALDFSNATSMQYTFSYAYFTRIGVVNISNAGRMVHDMFASCGAVTIDKLIVAESNIFDTNVFNGCTRLENLTIEGVIASNNFNLQWSTRLSKQSIESVISALSTDTAGLGVTLSADAVNVAFQTAVGADDGSASPEWLALVNSRPNWNILLV